MSSLADDIDQIDAIMGCSRELISLISQTSCLAEDIRHRTSHHAEYSNKAADVLRQLSVLRQIPRHRSGNTDTLVQIAEIKRLTALLYFHDRISSELHSSSAVFPRTFSIPHLQASIVQSLQNLPTSSGAALWPLFMLGNSNLGDSEQIEFVLDRLNQLEKSRYLGSVYHARRRVERDIRGTSLACQLEWMDNAGAEMCENERWISLA